MEVAFLRFLWRMQEANLRPTSLWVMSIGSNAFFGRRRHSHCPVRSRIHVHIHIHIHVHIHVHVHVHAHAHARTHTHTHRKTCRDGEWDVRD